MHPAIRCIDPFFVIVILEVGGFSCCDLPLEFGILFDESGNLIS